VQLIRGEVDLTTDARRGDAPLGGDGAAIEDVSNIAIQASAEAELLLFDLA